MNGKCKTTHKKTVKVVKRKHAAESAPTFVSTAKVERNIRREMAGVIGRWIDERRERSRAEKAFSDGKIRVLKNS